MTTTIGQLIDSGQIEALNGFSSGQHNQDGDGTPHMRPFNVTPGGSISLEQIKSIPGKIDSSRQLLKPGDILFNNTNTEELVGKTGYWSRDGTFAFSNHMTRVRVINRDSVSARFLAYALHQHWQAGESRMLCRRHVAQASIIGERFREISLPSPTKTEQEKVAAVLWKVQRAIELEAKLIATARELKQSAMHQLFTRGLRGETQKETERGTVPESWSLQALEELREFLQYGTSVKCDYHGKGNPVIRIPNVADGKVSVTDLKWCELTEREVTSLELEQGDVLFIRTNGVRERVGTCAVYQGKPEHALFASYLIRARLKTHELNPSFFQYFSMTSAGASQLSGRASPAADGKFNVNTKTIDSVLVPVPSPNEQHEITTILQTMDRKIFVHERKRATLQELFKTLLHQLMTGQIRVHNLDIDVSEVAGV